MVFDELLVLSVLQHSHEIVVIVFHAVLVNLRPLNDSIEVLVFSGLFLPANCLQLLHSVLLPAGVLLPADVSLPNVSP